MKEIEISRLKKLVEHSKGRGCECKKEVAEIEAVLVKMKEEYARMIKVFATKLV